LAIGSSMIMERSMYCLSFSSIALSALYFTSSSSIRDLSKKEGLLLISPSIIYEDCLSTDP